ncbi:MAG TPA: hypothetical protein VGI63_02535 [Verrucomicrobiae bacterium]
MMPELVNVFGIDFCMMQKFISNCTDKLCREKVLRIAAPRVKKRGRGERANAI